MHSLSHSYPTNLSSSIWLSGLNGTTSNDETKLNVQSPTGLDNCTHSQDIILSCLAGMCTLLYMGIKGYKFGYPLQICI